MNYETLTAQQALRIAELEENEKELKAAINGIHNIIFCIGGPLNDNKRMYTYEQKKDFFEISYLIEDHITGD